MVDLSTVVSAALYAAENLERWAGVEGVEEADGVQGEKEADGTQGEEEVKQDEHAHREDPGKHWHTTIHKQSKGLAVNISCVSLPHYPPFPSLPVSLSSFSSSSSFFRLPPPPHF